MADDKSSAPAEAQSFPSISTEFFDDDVHRRIMEAASVIRTVGHALDDHHAEERDTLEVAVRMLYRLDDDLESLVLKARREWEHAREGLREDACSSTQPEVVQ